jgi:hypothetical protein
MTEEIGRHVAILFRDVALLAMPASHQIAYLRAIGVAPLADELGLPFHDSALLAPQLAEHGFIDPWEVAALRQIDERLEQMPGEEWYVEALSSSSRWEEIRAMARDFLFPVQRLATTK